LSANHQLAEVQSLRDFFETAGDFLSRRSKRTPWPVGWKNLTVDAYQSAVDLWRQPAPAQVAQEKDKIAELYMKLAQAQHALPNPPRDVINANCQAAIHQKPKHPAAHELLSEIYLEQSRVVLNLQDKLKKLSAAIVEADNASKAITEAAQAAVGEQSENNATLARALVTLSSASVERANYDKTYREADLTRAVGAADEAAKLRDSLQQNQDYPFQALGNAYEDIAWLGNIGLKEKKKYYDWAIDAFKKAAEQLFAPEEKAAVYCSIGRCNYRMTLQSWLFPGMNNESLRNQQIDLSLSWFQKAVENFPDPKDQEAVKDCHQMAEAYYYLGLLSKCPYRQSKDIDYVEADKNLFLAKSIAEVQKDPSRALYTLEWARLPLEVPEKENQFWAMYRLKHFPPNPDFDPFIPQGDSGIKIQETLRRTKELLKPELPMPPGEFFNPKKEAAIIRAEIWHTLKDLAKSKREYDNLLPKKLAECQPDDYSLLMARANCEIAFPQDAIDDADQAAQLALTPEDKAQALGCAGYLRYSLYKKNNDPKILIQASKNLNEALHLVPQSPKAADWASACVMIMNDEGINDLQSYMDVLEMLTYSVNWAVNIDESLYTIRLNKLTSMIDLTNKLVDRLLKDEELRKQQLGQIQQGIKTWDQIQESIQLGSEGQKLKEELNENLKKLRTKL
jgi:hypothetical protein